MGPRLRNHVVPAAWLRGPGTGTLICALGALFAAVRRVQHAGMRALDTVANVSHAAQADAARAAQAPHHHDAREFAASSAIRVAPRRALRQWIPKRHR